MCVPSVVNSLVFKGIKNAIVFHGKEYIAMAMQALNASWAGIMNMLCLYGNFFSPTEIYIIKCWDGN